MTTEANRLNHGNTETQWVSFYLGEELFACPIKSIQEIIPYQEPIPVPGANQGIEGVLNVRGEIIPVVSGAEMTGSNQVCSNDENKDAGNIIIMDSDHGLLGMTIDSVSEIIQIEPDNISYEEQNSDNINGSALHDGRLIILLDINADKLCADSDLHQ